MNRGSSQVNLPIGDPRHGKYYNQHLANSDLTCSIDCVAGRMNEVLNHEYVNFAKVGAGARPSYQQPI